MKRTTNKKTITLSKEQVLDLFSSEAYLTVNKRLLKTYGPEVAVFFSNIVDRYRYLKSREMLLHNEWFYLIHKEQEEMTGLSARKIRSCKEILRQDDILTTKKFGNPAKEYYRISLESLMESLSEQRLRNRISRDNETASQEITKPHLYINRINSISNNKHKIHKNKKTSKKEPPKGSPVPIIDRNRIYMPMVNMLSKTILKTKSIIHTSMQKKAWCNEIRILIEHQGVDITRVKEALKWYRIHAGAEYVPIIESGRSLRDKFTKLEAAIERDKNGSFNSKKPSIGYRSFAASKQYRDDGVV